MESQFNQSKQRILIVYSNFGIGGITKSIINLLKVLDQSKYDITLYIRRNDVLDLIDQVPSWVKIITIYNEVKVRIFENDLIGKVAKFIYNSINKKHKHLAKQFFIRYKYPKQRKKEKLNLDKQNLSWDVAISYSTDEDDPIFVDKCIKAEKKYVFVHQSTKIAKSNLHIMNKFDGIICVNPMLIPWVKSSVKHSDRVFAIENYVDYENIIELAAQNRVDFKNSIVLSTCGRLCMTKGYDYVLDTAMILKRKGLNFTWLWIGDGPDNNKMNSEIKAKGLENEVIFIGNKSNPYPYINACNIYIQPSRAEAYSLTIIEALILGKPVISTNTFGGKYIFTKYNCGILVDENPEQIAKVILYYYNNQEKMNEEKKAVSLIDWEKYRTRYIKSWEDLLLGKTDDLS